MGFDSVIRGRRSIRAYEPEPVPEGVIREILNAARCSAPRPGSAPRSSATTPRRSTSRRRPSGRRRARPAAAFMNSRAATLEAAGEPSGPAAALARMAGLFGAPCRLVFGFDDCLAEAYAGFDTGSFVQNVCLAACDRGLGTCIVATVVRYPELLRRLLPGAEGKRFVVSVTLGFPEADSPANTFERLRADLDEIVTWAS